MMKKIKLVYFLKMVTFLFFTIISLWLIKTYAYHLLHIKDYPSALFDDKSEHYIFLGSSKTNYGINQVTFNQTLPGKKVLNVGVASSTLLTTGLITKEIMQRVNHSVFLVELNLMNGWFPPDLSLQLKFKTIVKFVYPLIMQGDFNDFMDIYMPFFGAYIFDEFRLKPYVNNLLNVEFRKSFHKQTVFYESKEFCPNVFYTTQDVHQMVDSIEQISPMYKVLMYDLIQTAHQTKNTILFYLPTAIKDQNNKNELFKLYNFIPIENKILYNDTFLHSINQPKNMYDNIHLNFNGSVVFSKFMANKLIELNL